MTAPRQVLPGKTYLVTRRCLQRQFLLLPRLEVKQVFGYLLAVTAERYGILLHAVCVLSNHYHLVVTDPNALLPEFARELNGNLARFLNALHGRFEAVFPPGSYSAVALEDEGAVLEKAAYALANPVAAGLVAHGRDWPGLWSPPSWIGRWTERFERPECFFDEEGEMPEEAELELVPPPGEDAEAFRRALEGRLGELERQAARKPDGGRRRFLGLAAVLAQRWWETPAKEEPPGALNPRIAAIDRWKRIEATMQLKSFLEAYREALLQLRKGVRDVVFPAGTYRLPAHYGITSAAPG